MNDASDAPGTGAPHLFRHVASLAAALAVVVLAGGTIGPPLVGRGVFLAADQANIGYPWRAYNDPADLNIHDHGPVTDTIDAAYPTRAAVAQAAQQGEFFGWNPYVTGGVPAATDSSAGSLSPFALLYAMLPNFWTPAVIKLVQMAVAAGFTFLFCRRLGLDRVPAVFAGAAFAGSGFMVMWTNWPQPEVAALIAPLFWATERYLQGPSVARAAPIAAVISLMLLGNFPAVVGFALYALGGYVALRLLCETDRPTRRRIATGAGVGAGLVVGALLVAVIMIPFAMRLGDLDLSSREQTEGSNLGVVALVTSVAPKALGLSTEPGGFYGPRNQVETVSFVGATTALLALAALSLPRPRSLPNGARLALGLATLVLGVAAYGGGPVLAALQHLPVFADNFVGRTTSVMGFTTAVLAATGLQAVSERLVPVSRRDRALAIAGIVLAAGLGALVLVRAHDLASSADRTTTLTDGLELPAVVGLAALALLPLVRSRRPNVAEVAMVALVGLLVVESLSLSLPLLPNEDRALLFPRTPGIRFLADNVGDERVAPQGLNLFASATTLFEIRSATGHTFAAETWRDGLLAADPQVYSHSPTLAQLSASPSVVTSPMLDRLGVRWFAANADHQPVGTVEDGHVRSASCDRPVLLDRQASTAVPAGNGLRGVVVKVCAPTDVSPEATIRGEAVGPDGGAAAGTVRLPSAVTAEELAVALPADDLGGVGEITVSLDMADSAERALALATDNTGAIAMAPIRPDDDGLRLAYADDLRIYERTRALPRIRWAGAAQVVEDRDARLDLLSSGRLPAGTTLLSAPGPTGSGADGTVQIREDSPSALRVDVRAEGVGYLVVADAMQADWVVTVDGKAGELVDADHAGVAVEVPKGDHSVDFGYRPRGQRAGLAVSVLTLVAVAVALAAPRLARSRRARH